MASGKPVTRTLVLAGHGFLGQYHHGQRTEGCKFTGFDHHAAAGCQCRCGLAGNHGQRKVPGRDGPDTDRLLSHDNPSIGFVRWDGVP